MGKAGSASPSLSPKAAPRKNSSHVDKTVHLVRRLTELHHSLNLELPLAPKELEGHGGKSARKNAARRQKKKKDDSDSDEGSHSDSSGWAIAVGLSDSELPRSPKHSA